MKKPSAIKGAIFRCPVCGAELAVLAPCRGRFAPRCCNQAMKPTSKRLRFFVCPVCGAEIAVLKSGNGVFAPRCCNGPMQAA